MEIKKKGYIFAANLKLQRMTRKVNVSQDTLHQYLTEHRVKLVRLAELTGLSEASINVCFNHKLGTNGKPRVFTQQAIEKINEALPQLAESILGCSLTFGSKETYTNRRGKTYDPALVAPIKNDIGRHFNLGKFCEKVLKWSKPMKHNILESKTGLAYGHVTKEDVERANTELIAVASVLASYRLIIDIDISDM